MNQRLEQMAYGAKFAHQKPTRGEAVKDFYDTARRYVNTLVQQAVENIKDTAVQAKNATQRVQLTATYIDALDQRISADLKRFEAAALRQYGEGFGGRTTEKGNERVMSRIGTRYDGLLRRLKAKLMPCVNSGTKPDLPNATCNRLSAMILSYEINNTNLNETL